MVTRVDARLHAPAYTETPRFAPFWFHVCPSILINVTYRFFVARGLVEKQWQADHGSMEYANYSVGTVFGITDTMLGR